MIAAVTEARKHIPGEIEFRVLDRSRRRCALCFHLNDDLTEKLGQIAHIDKNRANYAEDNLAWLCLPHHSLFDSKTSQHKNDTISEVKNARNNLYLTVEQGLHSATVTIEAPQGRNTDRKTLAHIVQIITRECLILLQYPNFVGNSYLYSRIDCLALFIRDYHQPQHEFIDPELEELRSQYRNNVIQFLSIAQTLTEPMPDDPARFALSTVMRRVYPDQYLHYGKVLDGAATKAFDSYQKLIRRARQKLEF